MIVDAHTHIFPENVRSERGRYFEGEPEFQLLYESPSSPMSGARELVAEMDAQGVDRSVTFGFPWHNPAYFKANNDYVIEAVRRYPARLTGLCCLDVWAKDAVYEVERCLDAGLGGVGELAFYKSGIDAETLARLDPVMALCRKRKMPVMFHTNEPVGHVYPGKSPNTLAQIYELARRYPENRIILAHWGGGIFFYMLMKKEVSEVLANVWFDTAASPFLYGNDIYPLAARIAGADKILWGTDYPLLKPSRYFAEVEASGVDPVNRDQILGLNAKALFHLG
jgi:hypothetical protein